ncbi:hypothetical protein KJ969_04625 [Patescibacteria group bacterium]|nr:hypothetical protein [Patescibacteria group bacterium]MBU1922519.1 hypothetical protein [Patescibacteria group bacterium]
MYNDKQILPASPIPPKELTPKKPRLGTFSTDAYERVKSLEMDLDFCWQEINPLLQQSKELKRKRGQLEADVRRLDDEAKDLWTKAQGLSDKTAKDVMRDRRSVQAETSKCRDELDAIRNCLRPIFEKLNELFEKNDATMSRLTALDPTRVYRRYQDRSQRIRPNEQELAAEKVNTELKRRWDKKKNDQAKAMAYERPEENQPKAGKHDFDSFRRLWGESKGQFMIRLEILHIINS